MGVVNTKIFSIFFLLVISIVSYDLSAQDNRIELGKYVHDIGSHGSTEMLIFNDDDSIVFSKRTLTRPSSEVCKGGYIIKGDTLYMDFQKDSIPFRASYRVVKELYTKQLDNEIIVHLNVLLKTIENRNEENPKKFAEYDSIVKSSRVNIKVIDSLGNKVLELKSFDSKTILQLSRKSELVVSTAGTLDSSKISLNRFAGNEVFLEFLTYEKYDLPCSIDNQKFYIQDISGNSITFKPSDSEDVIIYYKTE